MYMYLINLFSGQGVNHSRSTIFIYCTEHPNWPCYYPFMYMYLINLFSGQRVNHSRSTIFIYCIKHPNWSIYSPMEIDCEIPKPINTPTFCWSGLHSILLIRPGHSLQLASHSGMTRSSLGLGSWVYISA